MRYILIDIKSGDYFTKEFNTLEEATRRADYEWDHLTGREQRSRDEFYILESENPDEEAINHFCGNVVIDYTR